MRLIKRFGAPLAATVTMAVALSACSGGGGGNEGLTDDEEGFREASKVLATLIGEQDAEGFCSFLDAENEGTFLRAVGVQDCVAAAESRLSDITEDERASWVSADFSTTETRAQSPGRDGSVDTHRFCWARGAEIPIAEGAWAGEGEASGVSRK